MNTKNQNKVFLSIIIGITIIIAGVFAAFTLTKDSDPATDDESKKITVDDKNKVREDNCVIAGCSNELCVDKSIAGDLASICIYSEEFACYTKANTTCEMQPDNKCGWTQTPELKSCLNEKRAGYDEILEEIGE